LSPFFSEDSSPLSWAQRFRPPYPDPDFFFFPEPRSLPPVKAQHPVFESFFSPLSGVSDLPGLASPLFFRTRESSPRALLTNPFSPSPPPPSPKNPGNTKGFFRSSGRNSGHFSPSPVDVPQFLSCGPPPLPVTFFVRIPQNCQRFFFRRVPVAPWRVPLSPVWRDCLSPPASSALFPGLEFFPPLFVGFFYRQMPLCSISFPPFSFFLFFCLPLN